LKHERFGFRDAWIAAALFAANLLILGPWLLIDFSNQPWNNGYNYIARAVMFRDFKWAWNPLEYAGAPFHYLYPPLYHVLVAAMPVHSMGLAFHLVTGAGYALVPVAIYVLCRQLFAGTIPAAFAAIFYSVFPSPVYILPQWRGLALAYAHAPWGFVATVGYEEAAHGFGLPLALFALAAAWRGRWLLATLLTAAVMLTSWPALIGLGLSLGALTVAKARESGVFHSLLRTATLAGTGYGLSAFWIAPGYFVASSLLDRIALRHTLSAAPFNGTTWLILLVAAILVVMSFSRLVSAPFALVLAWVALTGAVVISFTLAGNYLLPLPHRYVLEFNVALVLGIAGLLSLTPGTWKIVAAAVVMIAASAPAFSFVTHAWKVQPHEEDPRTQIGFQIATWLNQHAGRDRIFATGELDATLPIWSNVPEVGGAGLGISSYLIYAAERQVGYGCAADSEHIAELWLRAMNIRYLVVHGAESREYYHWFVQPEKFAAMPVAWDNGAGDTIRSVPGFDGHDAVVVDRDELARLPRFSSTHDAQFLEAYVRWAAGKRPANIRWNGANEATLDGQLGPNEAYLVKISNDPGWRASGAVTESDPIGFLLIEAAHGQQIKLRFGPSWDAWLGRAITAVMLLGLIFFRGPRIWMAAVALIPTIAAYAILMAHAPSTVAVAEDAFVHLQPPIINPGGIIDGATNRPPPFERGKVIAAYGLNLGAAGDAVRVWAGDRPAEVVYHSPTMATFKMPADAPARAAVSVEVNGCRGNAFAVDVIP
jgi:hypothetical protein